MGIDSSKTCAGIVVLDEEAHTGWSSCKTVFTGELRKEHADDLTEGISKARRLSWWLDSWKPDLVAMEGYAFGNKHTLGTLVTIGTCLQIAIRTKKVPYVIVAPSQVTKFVVAGTPRKKEDVKLHAFKRWGFENPSNDITDAFCLAKIGLAWKHGAALKLTKQQAEVVAKVKIAWVDGT